MNAAGPPMPCPKPTTYGVLNIMAEIGAAPVTVRNRTPPSPTAPLRSLATSLRCETSKSSGNMPGASGTPSPPVEVSDCAMIPPRQRGAPGANQTRSRVIGLACALWHTSQRGRYHLVEALTRLHDLVKKGLTR